MNYFDAHEFHSYSADNPLVPIIGFFIVLFVVGAIGKALSEDARRTGLFRALAFWSWQITFFPLIYIVATNGSVLLTMLVGLIWTAVTIQLEPFDKGDKG